MASISYLAHRGPHGSFYGQAVRAMILAGTTQRGISWIRALWTAVSSPLIRSRDLNSGPYGPEPLSEISNSRPHGLVIFHSREDSDEL